MSVENEFVNMIWADRNLGHKTSIKQEYLQLPNLRYVINFHNTKSSNCLSLSLSTHVFSGHRQPFQRS